MVTVDSKRDYYADLDLPNTADPEIIKKRFRELGMKTGISCYGHPGKLTLVSQAVPP